MSKVLLLVLNVEATEIGSWLIEQSSINFTTICW